MNVQIDEQKCYDAIIVGGGLAGLTTAYQLRNKNILVLEKEARFGGRAFSEKVDKVVNNIGTQFFSDSDAALVKMFDELGIQRTHPNPIKVPFALHLNGTYYPDATKYMSAKVYWQFIKLVFRSYRKYRTFKMPMDDPRWQELIKDNAKGLYEGIGDELMHLYKAFMRVTCLTKPDRTSAGMGAAFGGAVEQGKIAIVEGGFQQITDRLAAAVGDKVLSSAEVTEVVERNGLVQVQFTHQGQQYTVQARDAVIAAPAPVVPHFMPELPQAKRNALESVVYGSISMVSLILKKDVPWQRFYAIINDNAIFQGGIDQTFGFEVDKDPEQPIVLNLIITPYPDETETINALISMPDAELVAKVLADFKKVVPNSDDIEAYLLDSKVTHYPIGEIELSPEYYQVLPELERSVGNIHFCGDYTDRMSFVDGTGVSAFRVARKLGSDLVVSEQEEMAFFNPPSYGAWGITALIVSLLLLLTGIVTSGAIAAVGIAFGAFLSGAIIFWAKTMPPMKQIYQVFTGIAGLLTLIVGITPLIG